VTESGSKRTSQQPLNEDAEATLQALLPSLIAQLEASRESSEKKEKRDRHLQSALEYWKAEYDLFKLSQHNSVSH
jgi:hypothetical protein